MSTLVRVFFLVLLSMTHADASATKKAIIYENLDPKPIWKVEPVIGAKAKLVTKADETAFVKSVRSSKVMERNFMVYDLRVTADGDYHQYHFKGGDLVTVVHFLGRQKLKDLEEDYRVPVPEIFTNVSLLDVLRQIGARHHVEDAQNLDFKNIRQALEAL